jgi:hypothetical protein
MDWGGGAGQGIPQTLADLGRIQAQGDLQSGAIWSHGLGDIASLIAGAPQRRLQQQELQARTAELQGLAQDRQLKVTQAQQAQAGAQALAQALRDPSVSNDPDKVYKAVAGAGFPQQAQAYLDLATKHQEALDKLQSYKDGQHQVFADILSEIDPSDPSQVTAAIGLAQTKGVPSELIQAYSSGADEDPVKATDLLVKSAPENMKASRTAAEKRAEEAAKIQFGPPGSAILRGGEVIGNVPKETVPKSLQSKSVLLDGKPAEANYNPADGSWSVGGQTVDASRVKPIPPAAAAAAQASDDPKDIAAAIARGEQPPTLTGLYRNAGPVRAELARMGYDLATAQTDWAATQKHVATLNGAQQTRLNQSVNALPEMLDSVETLAKEWKAGPFPVLTRANLALAKNGAWGPDAASIATRLESQIADVTADLGNVYMGGNSPTDHALELASKALNGNWDETVLLGAIKRARSNVQIRQNSIRNTPVQGASEGNPYAAPQAAPQPAATAPGVPSYADYLKSRQGAK